MEQDKKNEFLLKELSLENEILKNNMKQKQGELENILKSKFELENENTVLRKQLISTKEEIDSIKNSRSYRIIRKVKKILRR